MNNTQSLTFGIALLLIGALFTIMVLMPKSERHENNIRAENCKPAAVKSIPNRPDPYVWKLAVLIPEAHDEPVKLNLDNLSTSDPVDRQQARELAKAWVHLNRTRRNGYMRPHLYAVDKERYSLEAVALAVRAFKARGYKMSVTNTGFYYIVEIDDRKEGYAV